jgi:hypothetical protein
LRLLKIRSDVADGGDERRRANQVRAADRHRPSDLRPLERLLGDQALDRGDLARV